MSFLNKHNNEHSFVQGFLRVLFCSIAFWAALLGAYGWQRLQYHKRVQDERFVVSRIAARSLTIDKVPCALLAALSGVHKGDPLFSIDPDTVKHAILSCPSFQSVRVWRLLPGTLGVEYTMRRPIGFIADVRNVCFDAQGVVFFLLPYFPPKKLPRVILSMQKATTLCELQRNMNEYKDKDLVVRMLPILSDVALSYELSLEILDVSSRNHLNIFRREIVLVFSSNRLNKSERIYVRCNAKHISIQRLKKVFSYYLSSGYSPGIIDMRFPSCVLVKKDNV